MEAVKAEVQPALEPQPVTTSAPSGSGSSAITLSAAGKAILSEDLERRLKEAELAFIQKQKQQKTKKEKKIVRMAGGQVWEDNSLMEWDPGSFKYLFWRFFLQFLSDIVINVL